VKVIVVDKIENVAFEETFGAKVGMKDVISKR